MTKPLTKTPLEADTQELFGAMNSCNIESCLKYNHSPSKQISFFTDNTNNTNCSQSLMLHQIQGLVLLFLECPFHLSTRKNNYLSRNEYI